MTPVLSLKFRNLGQGDRPCNSLVINLVLVLSVMSETSCMAARAGMLGRDNTPFQTPVNSELM